MEKFQLSLLFKILGIGSASGLIYQSDKLYLISDSSTYLYEYHMPDAQLIKIPLGENPQENIAKIDKPDFEAITQLGDELYIFGSGSTEKRNRFVLFNATKRNIRLQSVAQYYQIMKTKLQLADDELNIEGVILKEAESWFFQRGNGASGKNGIIHSDGPLADGNITFIPFDLPKIKNVPATFTDAVLVNDKIYFLASAEDTESTYLDGEVLGSLIGRIDLKTLKLESSLQISETHKFEGLTLYKQSAKEIEFLLCEDTDGELLESDIYKLVLQKKQ